MIILCDIDGTLAHMMGKRGPFEWDKVHLDKFDPHVGYLLSMHWDIGDTIFLLSGRDSVCRESTVAWLETHNVRYHNLYMRPKQDFRPDTVVKREIWDTHLVPYFLGEQLTEEQAKHRILVYDDRNVVVAMWREMGLKVFQVAPGNF